MKSHTIGQPPTSRRAARFPASWLRAVVFLLAQALVLQPAAFAATWNIAQQPLFTINPVYPNAVFMIDDSWSMGDYRLPPPSFFSFNNRWPAANANVTVRYGAGTRTVAAHNEFTLRSSIHNPLAYDPAITYTPWNDNDKPQGGAGHAADTCRELPAMPISAATAASRPPGASPSATCAFAALRMPARLQRASGSRPRAAASAATEPTAART